MLAIIGDCGEGSCDLDGVGAVVGVTGIKGGEAAFSGDPLIAFAVVGVAGSPVTHLSVRSVPVACDLNLKPFEGAGSAFFVSVL